MVQLYCGSNHADVHSCAVLSYTNDPRIFHRPAATGDDVTPDDMRAFYVPAGKGVYFHPGTWHNGVYVAPEHSPATFLTRQGRVHARVSASWASEFGLLLRVPLRLPPDVREGRPL